MKNRAVFKMLGGYEVDSNGATFFNHKDVHSTFDQLQHNHKVNATSTTFVPEGVPFHHFYSGKTLGIMVVTSSSRVHASCLMDCMTYHQDSEGNTIYWNADNHQYERIPVNGNASDGVKRAFHRFGMLNQHHGIERNFELFKQSVVNKYNQSSQAQYYNEVIMDYRINDVMGVVLVDGPEKKEGLIWAKKYQSDAMKKFQVVLPILIYDKDKGSLRPWVDRSQRTG